MEGDALEEVKTRHPDLAEAEQRATAHEIAVGALRYFLLKFTRNSVIAFDFKEALSFEGETGPYCQYAAVRANSIFRKLDASGGAASTGVSTGSGSDRVASSPLVNAQNLITSRQEQVKNIFSDEIGNEIWSLLVLAARLEEANGQAAASAEPAILAKYTFNLFYHRHRIIAEEDSTRRSILIVVADYARRQLTAALTTMGITVPERM